MQISRFVQSAIVTLALAVAPALANANNTHGQMQSSQTGQSQSMQQSTRQGVKGNASDRAVNTNIRGYQDESGNLARGERVRTGQQAAPRDFSGAKPPITSANANTNTRLHGTLSQGRAIGGGPAHARTVQMDHSTGSSGGQSQRSIR